MSDGEVWSEGAEGLTRGEGKAMGEPPAREFLPQEVGEFACDDAPVTGDNGSGQPSCESIFHESVTTEDRLPPQLDEYVWSGEADAGAPDSDTSSL